jgi:hypothetical protein
MSSHLGSRLRDIYFSALKGEFSAIAEQVRAFQRFPLMLANRLNVTLHTFGSPRTAWEECQASRDRNAIYGYLSAVFDLVMWWAAEGRAISRARWALQLQHLDLPSTDEPFAAVIRCTSDPAKVDKRTRSKWSRVLRYAAEYKSKAEPLATFIRRKGGNNACAGRFTRCLGRRGPNCLR